MNLEPPRQVLAYVALTISLTILEDATGHDVDQIAAGAQSALLLLVVFGYYGLLEAIESAHLCLHELLDEELEREEAEA